jgi:hypothetical protein
MLQALKNWYAEFRAMPAERRRIFYLVAPAMIVALMLSNCMARESARLETVDNAAAALERISPAAAEEVRVRCRDRWSMSEDCAMYYALAQE